MEVLGALDRVSKLYGRKTILRNVSLTLQAGSISLVCGANGAGKSTLLRLLALLGRPSGGKIVLAENTRIGYLGHSTFLYPELTALEHLEFWAKSHRIKASEEDLLRLLDRMNLRRHAHEPARIFSRGMAQRLNFTRILVQNANLLLLDEPFSGLDLQSQNLMRQEIKAKCAAGSAIAIVSHALATDISLADNIIAIKKGKAESCRASEFAAEGMA